MQIAEPGQAGIFTDYIRRKSRIVNIGDIPLGGSYPMRVQSMTTTDTMDTEKTVAQSIRMIEAGSDYVRITAPSLKEAENLANIKKELRSRGYNTPLIADIHFTPNAAELAARIVEKVRVNPGNYIDKKKFEVKEYTDLQYEAEIERIRKRFSPLVMICKEYGTAMRIGTNHGSLSDRIMNRYGDSPEGMVESAMEFLRICSGLNYHDIVLSMKSSNPMVMIQAYRLLVKQMDKEGMDYPLHLGVTEAGEAEEGRIKSAMGIGTLLEEGLGDTIRVSLTEEPEFEIPVAKTLVERYERRGGSHGHPDSIKKSDTDTLSGGIPTLQEIATRETLNFGGHNVPRVIADYSNFPDVNELSLRAIDYHFDAVTDKWNMGEQGADYIYLGRREPGFMLPNGAKGIFDYAAWLGLEDKANNFPLLKQEDFEILQSFGTAFFLELVIEKTNESILEKLRANPQAILIISTNATGALSSVKGFISLLNSEGIINPVIVLRDYQNITSEQFLIYSAIDAGGVFAEGMGNGIWLKYIPSGQAIPSVKTIRLVNTTSFNILQAARARISKTEYISCPSCGRTLFDLQETTAMIRSRTDHLKGIKIAIMGCIVNGPGEMADADYGYVGTGPGKITLYKGKDVVKRNIDSSYALQELINIIKEGGQWIDKQ
jgi:(E)-4-hydroxy-3-methylbut-2-enyl-diphosphate synthase